MFVFNFFTNTCHSSQTKIQTTIAVESYRRRESQKLKRDSQRDRLSESDNSLNNRQTYNEMEIERKTGKFQTGKAINSPLRYKHTITWGLTSRPCSKMNLLRLERERERERERESTSSSSSSSFFFNFCEVVQNRWNEWGCFILREWMGCFI